MSCEGVQNVLRYTACALGVATALTGVGLVMVAIGCILLLYDQA